MKTIMLIVLSMCMLSTGHDLTQSEGWRGIVPLRSTRADVERLIGAPINSVGTLYDFEGDRIFVYYQTESCRTTDSKGHKAQWGWDAPRDTVIGIKVHPSTKISFSSLQIDKSKYKKSGPHPHENVIVYYSNEEDGISYAVDASEGSIRSVTYSPAAKYDHLRCPASPSEGSNNDQMEPPFKSGEYSDLSPTKEGFYLDNFASDLRRGTELKGYIIAYAGRHARTGEAEAQAKRVKHYLVNKRGIDAERIVAMDGGHREKLAIELYIVQPGAATPTATPTVSLNEVQIIKDNNTRNNNHSSSRRRKQHRPCQ